MKVGSRVWSVLVSPVSPVGRYESTEVWSLQSYCRQTASHHLQSLLHSYYDTISSPHLTSHLLHLNVIIYQLISDVFSLGLSENIEIIHLLYKYKYKQSLMVPLVYQLLSYNFLTKRNTISL